MKSRIRSFWTWLFSAPPLPVRWGQVIWWWELRRIPCNLLIGSWGFLNLNVFYWAAHGSGRVQSGEDPIEPAMLVLTPFLFNVAYTGGWVFELMDRRFTKGIEPNPGPRLLKAGLLFSMVCVSIPALFWMGVRILQVLRVVE